MFRFKANGQSLNILEVNEYSSGTYHCIVINRNGDTVTGDVKVGEFYLYFKYQAKGNATDMP